MLASKGDHAAPLLGLPSEHGAAVAADAREQAAGGGTTAAEQHAPPGGASPSKHARLASLDVVRGFAIALMIFVDELGGEFPRPSRFCRPFPLA